MSIRVLIAGDYYPNARISIMLGNSDFSFFSEVKELTRRHDFNIVNLEAPIVADENQRLEKYGPNLKCPAGVVDSIKYAGFNMLTLANNHIMDYGEENLLNTLEQLSRSDIEYVGAGKNYETASQIKYFEKDDEKLAIINCCEHEFSIAREKKAGANPLDPIKQYYKIKEAKETANYVLIIVHGGHEHWQLPSIRMVETYKFFIDAGADAVVNHHQHCFSGYEIYKNKPIFYGIGNFCFDSQRRDDKWCEGFIVSLEFNDSIKYKIYPTVQCKKNPAVKFMNENYLQQKISFLNDIVSDKKRLEKETEQYYSSQLKNIELVLEPYHSRILKKLFKFRLLPKWIKGEKKKMIENNILCESHRDKLKFYFQKNVGN